MLVIGMTGRSGSGKGYVSAIFESYGIPTLDTDAVSRLVYEPGEECYSELVSYFGSEILREDKTIDRKALFSVAFSSEEKYEALNKIAHRHILDYSRSWISRQEESGVHACIIDAPLLFESGFDLECDFTLAVVSNDDLRIKRLKNRDGIDEETAKKRLSKQKNDSFYIEECDFSVYNNEEDRVSLKNSINNIINKLKENEKWKTLRP